MLADEGVTVTEATGTGAAEMVITDVPVLPSLVAVTVAAPTDTAVTSPFASTDAAAYWSGLRYCKWKLPASKERIDSRTAYLALD